MSLRGGPSRFLHLAILVTLMMPTAIAAPKPASAMPPLLREVERNYAKAGTISAQFRQVNESAELHTKKTSSGQITIKRPDKLRWQTLAPDPNLFVSDGKHAWFYTPPFDPSEHGQYSEYPASKIRSKLANSLLAGEFSAARDLKITALSDREFELKPKRGTAGSVVDARIEIDPKEKVITRIQLSHDDGNHSDIQLSDVRLGAKVGQSTFVFSPPPGTERIRD